MEFWQGEVSVKPIYHITHVDNLSSIIAAGGIWCDAERIRQRLAVEGIGYEHIKERRMKRSVPVAAGGVLGDYVPFYFAPRSPMLFVIDKRSTEYKGGQEPIVHLTSNVAIAQQNGNPVCFTDGHAEMGIACYNDDVSKMDEFVDWPVMGSTYWNDNDSHPNRKFRRQAEFLVHQFFPWEAIIGIGVIDEDTQNAVSQIVNNASHTPQVEVKRGWYY